MTTPPCSYTLNTDISGIGVRISYYLQTLFLGFLSARSGSLDEITGALYTLMATNSAMAVTGLILGLKPAPEISFQDALIMIYLLSMGWITVLASLASCNRLSEDTKILQLASVVQSYVVVAFAFAVLGKATSFGNSANCNQEAVAVIFHPFSALKSGHILGWIVVVLMALGYTVMTGRDYTAQILRKIREKEQPRQALASPDLPRPVAQERTKFADSGAPAGPTALPVQRQSIHYGTPRALIDGRLLFMLLFIIIFWAFFVLNTELVIRWNQPTQAGSGASWQFGQILPMFLAILPLINMVNAFNQFGIKPTRQVYQQAKVSVIYDVGFDAR
ncbi:hypothetical protein B0H19DRAFT_1153163 [Mycena capillaripes]|nr:hypothetical protein B0H19DRAFT_1153163 [Mycena capillaripes]